MINQTIIRQESIRALLQILHPVLVKAKGTRHPARVRRVRRKTRFPEQGGWGRMRGTLTMPAPGRREGEKASAPADPPPPSTLIHPREGIILVLSLYNSVLIALFFFTNNNR